MKKRKLVGKFLAGMLALTMVVNPVMAGAKNTANEEVVVKGAYDEKTRSQTSGVNAVLSLQVANNNQYWTGFDMTVTNTLNESVRDWIIKLEGPSGSADKFKCWNATAVKEGDVIYLYPKDDGSNAIISANSNIQNNAPGFGYSAQYSLSDIQVKGVTFEKGSSAAFDYSTGETFDADHGQGGNSGGGSSSPIDASTNKDLDVEYNYAKLLQESLYFYDANMCGELEGKCGISWRGNCHLQDKNNTVTINGKNYTVDTSGGFHDAGDHVKFGLPQGYASAALAVSYYEFAEAYEELKQTEHLRTILDYFCDYYKRCTIYEGDKVVGFVYQTGEGGSDHALWTAPEKQSSLNRPIYVATSANPATDEVSVAAATLALCGKIFGEKVNDAKYNSYVKTAKDLFEFAKSNSHSSATEGVGGFYDSRGCDDDYALAAAALYLATDDNSYKSIYDSNAQNIQDGWVLGWDNAGLLGSALMNDTVKLAKVTDNMKNASKVDGLYCVLDDWGSCRYNSAAQFTGLIYDKLTGTKTYDAWAVSQMNYMIGDNPSKRCFAVGYNENSSKYPHHRAASRSGDAGQYNSEHYTLLGALVGGPNKSGEYTDSQSDFRANEVALDYNAGYVGALAGLYLAHKNDTETNLSYGNTSAELSKTLAAEAELSKIGVTIYYGDGSVNPPSGSSSSKPGSSSNSSSNSSSSNSGSNSSSNSSSNSNSNSSNSGSSSSSDSSSNSNSNSSSSGSSSSSDSSSSNSGSGSSSSNSSSNSSSSAGSGSNSSSDKGNISSSVVENKDDGSSTTTTIENKDDGSLTTTTVEEKGDGSSITTKVEEKGDGSSTTTKVEEKSDGSSTTTKVEEKSDGSSTTTKVEEKGDGSSTTTKVEQNADGTSTTIVTEVASDGSTVTKVSTSVKPDTTKKATVVTKAGEKDDAAREITISNINIYNGKKIMPNIDLAITAADGTKYALSDLTKKDYKITYKNNLNANMEMTESAEGKIAYKRMELPENKQPQIIITYKGRLKGLAKDVIKFDIYPCSIENADIMTNAKGGVITVKPGKSLKFLKKAIVQLSSGKRKSLNKKKDLAAASTKLVPVVNGSYDVKAAGLAEGTLAAPELKGDYVIVITGKGNFCGTKAGEKITVNVE